METLSVSVIDVISIIKNNIPNESIYTDYPDGIRDYQMPTREHYLMMVHMCERMFNDVMRELSDRVDINEFKKEFYSDENGMVKVGLYDIGKCYGGAEEGGWYYTQKHLAESKLMSYEDAIRYVKDVDKENHGRYEYQGYQVAYIELAAGQHEKTYSQYYC